MHQKVQKLKATERLKKLFMIMRKKSMTFVCIMYVVIMYAFTLTSEQNKALQDYHMPFKFDDSQVEKKENIVTVLQRGFINRYTIETAAQQFLLLISWMEKL